MSRYRPNGMVNNMAIAPKLQLKQGQSLMMTPQLQQAIKLLQLSNIELAAYVDEQLERVIHCLSAELEMRTAAVKRLVLRWLKIVVMLHLKHQRPALLI